MAISIGPQTVGLTQAMNQSVDLAARKRQLEEEKRERQRQLYLQLAQLTMQGVDTAGKAATGGAAVGLW